MITQKAYRELREEVKEFIHSDTLFKEVLQGSPLIRGFKADVSFNPLSVSIVSVSLLEIDSNTISKRDLERCRTHLEAYPLSAIGMVCVDFDYDFKVFKSSYQSFDDVKFDFTLSDECGEVVAIKCIDVTGNEVVRTFTKKC